jgi:hypothetical protein
MSNGEIAKSASTEPARVARSLTVPEAETLT